MYTKQVHECKYTDNFTDRNESYWYQTMICLLFDPLMFLRSISELTLSFLVSLLHVLFMMDIDLATYGPKRIANTIIPIMITPTSFNVVTT